MSTPSSPDSSAPHLLEHRAVVAALFLALALGMTYPLALNFQSSVPAGSGDVWQNYWNFWWWEKCLLELGQSPYHSDYLFHPAGTDLIFHTHSAFNMIAALPVTAWLGPAAAYNFSVLLALWLSGWGGYLLARELTGDARGALLAGIVFAYFPQHIEQTLEHVNLFSTQFIPLTLLYFFRLCRDQSKANVVKLAILFALNALCSWHLGIKLLLTLAALAAAALFRPRRPRGELVRDFGLAVLLAGILLLPAAAPLLGELPGGNGYFLKGAVDRGIDVSYLLTPPYAQPLWGRLAAGAYLDRAYQAAGFVCYLGFIPLLLAALAIRRSYSRCRFWVWFGAATLILSMGAHPFWRGELIESITLPFALLSHVPLLSFLRVANRFLILTSLALALLAAYGWSALPRKSNAVLAAVAGLILIEYCWAPYPIRPAAVSPIYQQLARDGRPGAVLDIPFNQRNRTVHNMLAQTVHERPIGGGYLSTFPPQPLRAIAGDPVLADLSNIPKLERPIDRRHLLDLGFAAVVLHKYRRDSRREALLASINPADILGRKNALRLGGIPDETMDEIRRQLTELCGPPAHEDNDIALFYLDADAEQAP